MSRGRAYQKDDTVYRVRLEYPAGGVTYLGPYSTIGAARGQRSSHCKVQSWDSYPRPTGTIEKSHNVWELVPDE